MFNFIASGHSGSPYVSVLEWLNARGELLYLVCFFKRINMYMYVCMYVCMYRLLYVFVRIIAIDLLLQGATVIYETSCCFFVFYHSDMFAFTYT